MSNELQKPIASQWNNSIVWLAAGAIMAGPLIFAGQLAAINAILPPVDAAPAKELLFTLAKSLLGSIGAGAPLALFGRSLLLTHAKTKQPENQTPQVPTGAP